jgi:PAS domain-containing protein
MQTTPNQKCFFGGLIKFQVLHTANRRQSGIKLMGDLPWGTHLCQFYESKQDLIDTLVPYFAKGLRNNEFCMWVTSPPLEVAEAKEALEKAVPHLDEYFERGQIEVVSYKDWYLLGEKFDAERVLEGWVKKEEDALKIGFDGLRLSGNTFWVERNLWQRFVEYEETVNSVIGRHKILALCTYCLKNCSGTDTLDVVRNHDGALIKQGNKWAMVEEAVSRKKAEEYLKQNNQRINRIIDSTNDGTYAIDKDWNFIYINKRMAKLAGYEPSRMTGKNSLQFFLRLC